MADLNQLVQEALGGIINKGGLPLEEDLYKRQAQSEMESTFGRGLGISSVSRDALAKARTDAALAAQNAQLSALGSAAGVAQRELDRGQQASQFGQQLGLQKKGLGQANDIANKNLIASGVGLGVGGLGQVAGRTFGPEITGGLRKAFGLGPLGAGGGEVGGVGQQILSAPGTIDTSMPSMPDLSGISSGVTSNISSPGDFGNLGDLGLGDLLSGGGGGYGLPDLADMSWLQDALWMP